MVLVLLLLLGLAPAAQARSVAVDIQKAPGDGVLSEARSVDVLEGERVVIEFFGEGYANVSGVLFRVAMDSARAHSVQAQPASTFPVALPGTSRWVAADTFLVQFGALMATSHQGAMAYLGSLSFVAEDTLSAVFAFAAFVGGSTPVELSPNITLAVNAAAVPPPAPVLGLVSIDLDPSPGDQGQDSATAIPGDSVTVQVFGAELPLVSGYGLVVGYGPPASFVVGSLAAGAFLPGASPVVRLAPGSAEVGVASLTRQAASGSGHLATFRLALPLSFADSLRVEVTRLDYSPVGQPVDGKPVTARATIYKGEPGLLGDFDGDRRVAFSDFVLFAGAFGSATPAFDLDHSGDVGFGDFVLFAAAFGASA